MNTVYVRWTKGSSVSVLGRLTAKNATGQPTGVVGEGRWLKQENIDSITCRVFDLTTDPNTAVATPSVVIADCVLDTPVTDGTFWDVDDTGYNFMHPLPSTLFPDIDHEYEVEYRVNVSGGETFALSFVGPARPVGRDN